MKKQKKKQKAVGDVQAATPDELVQMIGSALARLPEVPPVTVASPRQAERLERLNQRAIDASLTAVGSTPAVQLALGRTKAEIMQEAADAVDWDAAIDLVGKLHVQLMTANRRRRQLVGLTALQTYGICTQLARESAHADSVAPHVDAMKRALKKHKAPQQQPAPAPQPVQ
jgi:hypothetical protein